MGRLAARLAKEQDPVTHIRRQNVSDNQRYPDQEVNFQGNAPIQISHEDYFGAQATASPELDDLEAFQSSANGGFASRKTTQVRNLTNLIGGDYFGKQGVNQIEEEFEGASQDGNASDYEDDKDLDPLHAMMARQDGEAVTSEYERLDTGQLNVMDNHFKDWSDLANESLPSQAAVGQGSPSSAEARAAADGGMDPNWRTTPTRNLRDLEQLPFAGRRGAQRMLAGFGVRPGENTRERTTTPDTIGQGLARRNLGLARAQFNKSAGVLGRLTGPQHAGTSAVAPSARAIVQRRSDTATIRARVARMTRANGGSDRLEDAEEGRAIAFGNRRATASLMNYTPLDRTRDRRGDPTATTIAEAPEAQEDDNLTSGLRPDYFSADSMVEENQPEAPGYDAAQAEADRVAAGGMTFDQERAAKALRNPKKAKLYARMAEIKAQREAAPPEVEPSEGEVRPQPKPGLFSRIGGALAKAGRVVGNALSSAGRGISSMLGFGSRRGTPTSESFNPAQRAQDARVMARDEREDEPEETTESTPDVSRRLTFNASSPDYIQEKPEIKYGRMLDENYAKSREVFGNFAQGYRDMSRRNEDARGKAERMRALEKIERDNETRPDRAARIAQERGEGQVSVPGTGQPFAGLPEINDDTFVDEETKQKRADEKREQQARDRAALEAELEIRRKQKAEEERKLRVRQDAQFKSDRHEANEAVKGSADQAVALHAAAGAPRLIDYFSADRMGVEPEQQASLSSSVNLQERHVPSAELGQASVSEAPISKGVINLPKNGGMKAKLVGPQETAADKAEGARMLAANNAKMDENVSNNKKWGFKAKKIFGLAEDQRIDPEYAGKSSGEATELAMQARLAREERLKATKKKRVFG